MATTRTAVTRVASTGQLERVHERARVEELLSHVERNMGLITDAFFEIGTALTEISNNRLYLALGYRSFAEMLERRRLMSQAQANKLIAVATLMPREAAVKLGPEKSYALTRFADAAEVPGGLQALLDSGRVKGRALEAVSVRDLAELTRELRGDRRTRVNEELVEARRLARHAQAAMRKAGMEDARVEAVGPRGETFRVTVDAAGLARLAERA